MAITFTPQHELQPWIVFLTISVLLQLSHFSPGGKIDHELNQTKTENAEPISLTCVDFFKVMVLWDTERTLVWQKYSTARVFSLENFQRTRLAGMYNLQQSRRGKQTTKRRVASRHRRRDVTGARQRRCATTTGEAGATVCCRKQRKKTHKPQKPCQWTEKYVQRPTSGLLQVQVTFHTLPLVLSRLYPQTLDQI